MATIYEDNTNFFGDRGRDSVVVLANQVVVRGEGGGDWLSAILAWVTSEDVESSVELWGGEGNDRLHVTTHVEPPEIWDELPTTSVAMDGGGGDDELWAEFVNYGLLEVIHANGGDGNDSILITSVPSADYTSGAPANGFMSSVAGGDGNDDIYIDLQTGSDFAYASLDLNLSEISGGSGSDSITSKMSAPYGDATTNINGGSGDDTISATTSTGVSDMGGGGLARNNIQGGDGSDTINSTSNGEYNSLNDISGGGGDDNISAEALVAATIDDPNATNLVSGGDGIDKISAKVTIYVVFPDETFPASGLNQVYGGEGSDRLTGIVTLRNETVANAHSELYGGTGNDRLKVSGGAENFLTGNQGNDTLLGSTGADRMIGGQGDDYLRGYAGDDTFEFQSARDGERDRIDGFAIGDDVFDVSRIDANAFQGGNQSFSFNASGDGGTGEVWVEDYGTRSIVHADTGRAILDIVLLDGRGVDASDYGADSFIL